MNLEYQGQQTLDCSTLHVAGRVVQIGVQCNHGTRENDDSYQKGRYRKGNMKSNGPFGGPA